MDKDITISKEQYDEYKTKLLEVLKGLDTLNAYTILGDLQSEVWRKALHTTVV